MGAHAQVARRRGHPEELESLEETLAILSDEDTMRQLREAEREVAAGDTLDATELRG